MTKKLRKFGWGVFTSLLLLLRGNISAAFGDTLTAPQFENGDRVCFIGDSITDIGYYHAYLRLFYATRFPDRKIEYFPAGHSGGTADDCLRRLGWDILVHSPTVVTVNFGMNDMGGTFGAPKASPEEVEKGIQERMKQVQSSYETLLDALTAAGVRLVLVGPSIFDDTVQIDNNPPQRSNRAMSLWTQRVKEIAERRKAGFIDLGTEMNEVNARLQAVDPKATIVGQDRVHPCEAGNLVMAYSILKAQGITPDVAGISLDATEDKAINLVNCSVKSITRQKNGISFVCQENALPFPTPYRAEKALEWIPLTEDLNREILTITNLPAGRYDLHIDSAIVGQFDASEFTRGINLSQNPKTPQFQQAQRVLQYNDRRHQLERELRYLPFLRHSRPNVNLDWNDAAAVDKYLREEIERLNPGDYYRHIANAYLRDVSGKADALRQQIEESNKMMEVERRPKAHTFSIVRADEWRR